jgi:hypothetical protein
VTGTGKDKLPTVRALYDPDAKVEFTLNGYLPRQMTTMLAGKRGGNKTLLAT